MSTNFKTPTASARGLGSAKSGTGHHIKQRVSAIALLFLIPWFLYAVIAASRGGYDGATAWLAQPWNAILMILTLGAAFYHMRLGMQVVIEDYIQKAGMKQGLLILNTFACVGLFTATALSVLKVWISAGL
ncbi:succinate dehydrogenase, hydrophobic membrane anchor protein [Henriciella algicola]|jgi:succinate dehydrogenase / fumarate reductase, membrane anchor subunit|uniref:Succinate dehydrogenase hydrophobic membrane anchor subunit n=1 Tax=Henriciella algicola TaxID=1608422 RepID=A0A399RM48_9PROT|nr:succinate dehydrogenase, hydrophobic membrane anchor protein [Henriciella algicola]RIJ31801.1 succinate dehydrogenase, hydrophobic membrane anchor protein [Henriciella algicola]|tara:strand:+ start:797 stop:1189 length:393 start_codon:yes stop_codon:yes gene_type:complete